MTGVNERKPSKTAKAERKLLLENGGKMPKKLDENGEEIDSEDEQSENEVEEGDAGPSSSESETEREKTQTEDDVAPGLNNQAVA